MNRPFYLFSAILVFAAGLQINAQDSQVRDKQVAGTAPRFRRALVIDIEARVLEKKEVVIWEENTKKITFPGNPVGIKLVGSNLVVAVQFTPFVRREGQSVLVAQGQIWIEDPDKGLCYYTSIQTIPMVFGEPIYFFPLGSSQQLDASIEIILTVNPNTQPETAINAENEK